ncbi:Cytochrome P450 monooxygenase helB3 [Metarhizium brunneum]|uniref:Cytochrome P450 monooxygenase helB3 n=1 Tax=Metarhizium brunneum TaxID=500148 RepID=A0A7D5UYU3_9HYPO
MTSLSTQGVYFRLYHILEEKTRHRPSWIEQANYTAWLLCLVVAYATWKIAYARLLSPLRHIPGPMASRLTSKRGTWAVITGKASDIALADYNAYGDVYVAKPNAVFLCDPEDARNVLSVGEFRKTDMYRIFEYEGVPNVSTFTDPVEANRRRRQLHPFFNYGYLAKVEHKILEKGFLALRERWNKAIDKAAAEAGHADTTVVNYRIDTQLAMFDITGVLVFGRDFHALRDTNLDYTSWVNNTLTYMLLNHYFPVLKRWPFSGLTRRLKKSYDDLARFSRDSITIRKQLLDRGDKKPVDLLQALLDSVEPDSKIRMTSREVQTESISMLVGGSESTSSVISWVIHFLLLYPNYFTRVVNEVRSEFPPDHVITQAESRAKLPFLEACIYETLRCIPTASTSFPRISHQRGITVKGHYIPPGTEIVTNKCAAHVHRETWEDPFDFKPDRFIGGNNDSAEAKRNMLSFAYGTRVCIGKNLAWVVMMVTLANLFNTYDISIPDDSIFRPENVDADGRPKIMPTKLGVATMPANPDRDCRMVIKKRASA